MTGLMGSRGYYSDNKIQFVVLDESAVGYHCLQWAPTDLNIIIKTATTGVYTHLVDLGYLWPCRKAM